MPRLAHIAIYPIKALDPVPLERVEVLPNGALAGDRRWALCDRQGHFINGKRTPRVHQLRAVYDLQASRVTLRVEGAAESAAFDLQSERAALCQWLGEFFDMPVTLVENPDGGFPDDEQSPGPTLTSTATLTEVGRWFVLDAAEARERFRANLEIDGVEAFWEDRLVRDDFRAVRFRLGTAELLGTNPCQRCVVPTRSPRTGETTAGFAREFAARRLQSLPAWASRERFDHGYRLAVNTRGGRGRGQELAIGDELEIVGVE